MLLKTTIGLAVLLACAMCPSISRAEGWSLAFAGDIMMGTDHPTPRLPTAEGRALFAPAASAIAAADLAFGNLEGPIAEGGASTKGGCGRCYAFRTPTRLAPRLREAGFDAFSVANNHANDFGATGRLHTAHVLDGLGLAWAGTPTQPIAWIRTPDGRLCALLAFATGASNPRVQDTAQAQAWVRQAAARADLVVVSFHAGAEGAGAYRTPVGTERYLGEDRGDVRRFARAVIAAGADVVFGHGPHVPRGMEVIDGHLVAYSLGNFVTYGPFAKSGALGLSPLLWVETDAKGRFQKGRILSFRQTATGLVTDPQLGAARWMQERTAQDFGTALEFDAQGGFRLAENP